MVWDQESDCDSKKNVPEIYLEQNELSKLEFIYLLCM